MPPVLVPFQPQGADPVRLRLGYATNVLRSQNGTEQRIQLRTVPRRALRMTYLLHEPRRAALLDALLYDGPDLQFAVPFWPQWTRLTANAGAGASSLDFSSTNRDFVANGYAVLWRDDFTTELVQLATVGASSSTLVGVTSSAWLAGDRIMPAHLGILDESARVGRPTFATGLLDLTFDIEPTLLPASGGAGGVAPALFQVVSQGPNRTLVPEDELFRSMERLDAPTSGFANVTFEASPRATFKYRLFLDSLALVQTFRTWFDARVGRLNPAWIPTYQHDLTPTGAILSADTSLTIESIDYTTRFFPAEARRHVAFIVPGTGAVTHRRVTASVDNGNGTETLDLNAAVGTAFPANPPPLVSFMRYARLDADDVELLYRTLDLAECDLTFVEVPIETPTTT